MHRQCGSTRGLGDLWNSSSSYSNTGRISTAVTPNSTRCGICHEQHAHINCRMGLHAAQLDEFLLHTFRACYLQQDAGS
jgi:hypothetical protein